MRDQEHRQALRSRQLADQLRDHDLVAQVETGERFVILHLQRVETRVPYGKSSIGRTENVFTTESGFHVTKQSETCYFIFRDGRYIETMVNPSKYADRFQRFRQQPSTNGDGDGHHEGPVVPQMAPPKRMPEIVPGQVWRRKRGGLVRILKVEDRITVALRAGVEFDIHKLLAAQLLADATLVRICSARLG